MEVTKKICPNCSQLYVIKGLSLQKINAPLHLACGHSMCESCITKIVKFGEPIECKVCHRDMEISAKDLALLTQNKINFHQIFPVNYFMLGEITMQVIENADSNQTPNNDFFIDLQAILKHTDRTQGECVECRNPSSKICKQCTTILCDSCFIKTHKNFIVFKSHALEIMEPQTIDSYYCKQHKDKSLDYYCKDCSKSICMDCMMVGGEKSCKSHNVVAMDEMNEEFCKAIDNISPTLNDIYKRLTKTAVDIGSILNNMANDTGASRELTILASQTEQHFSKLFFILQKHKIEILNMVHKSKHTQKKSLMETKNKVAASIKHIKIIINTVKASTDPDKIKQINLWALLEEAQKAVDVAWHLSKDETQSEPLKVSVNEDLYDLVSDYLHLEGNVDAAYKLCSTKELGDDVEIPPPPKGPVFPPELLKDVRQMNAPKVEKVVKPKFVNDVPTYRSKAGSTSSLNSSHGEGSLNEFVTPFGDRNKLLVQPVSPFEESQQPKPILEGSQEVVYMSHIVDPHNFFVQRSCHQKLIRTMISEFRNAISLPKPSRSHVAEGKVYLAFNKADNMWQRSRVVSIDRKDINNPVFHVFCIDFGSNESVTLDKLRLLPPARVQSPSPLAINCSLANCEPKSGSWNTEDSFFIQKIIDNKKAVIHVRHIRSTSNFNVTLECDVITIEDGVSLAHALVFHDRAKMPQPKLPYPKIMGLIERPKLFMNHDFKLKATEEVLITHVVSPDKFFVRKKYYQEIYEKLCDDLDTEMSTNSRNMYLPELGSVCAVNMEKYKSEVEESCMWARAFVVELPGRGRVRVRLVDTGVALLVHWTALRHLPHKLTPIRALATECHLAGVTPVNKKWSPSSVALLKQYLNCPLELEVFDNRNKDSVGVALFYKGEEEDVICINNEMLRRKFAISFGMYQFTRYNSEETPVLQNRTPLDQPKIKPRPKTNQIKLLKRSEPEKSAEEDLEAKDKGPLRLEVKLLSYQTPSLFYVALLQQQKSFNELFESIQKLYLKSQQTKADFKKGDRVCAFCDQSQTWRRAIILELEGANVKVFYSDFAFVETVALANLRELTKEFSQIGDAAIKCHLCNVIPAIGEEWPSISKEFLKELLDVYKRIFITKVGNFKNNSMPVELWVYHTEQGGALEPNKSEWRCLNNRLIEQGLGIPDKTQEPSLPEDKENSEEVFSFLGGSIQDWLQLEPMPTKPILAKFEEDENARNSSTPTNDDEAVEQIPKRDTVFISEWLPPDPLSNTKFTAIPTYIDNHGIIYLHDIAQKETLDLIRKALDVKFQHPDPRARFTKWAVGDPCVALFFLDNCFYRGKVLEVNYETSKCLVHYIDYGNEELVAFENMRKSIPLHQIPTQAHKCFLERIRPAEGNTWDRKVLDYIHKIVVDKQCLVKVIGSPVNGITPIELKYDKLSINDHLVDFEMAVYSDGSKAVLKKVAPATAKQKIYYDKMVCESDSGPDYTIEEDKDSSGKLSIDIDEFATRPWVELMEEEKEQTDFHNFHTYSNQIDKEFRCNITIINDLEVLELAIELNEESSVVYEQMFKDIQDEGAKMKPLNGIYGNKACIARFSEDNQWYRASILQYSESKNQIKVRYVDYGNVEVVDLADARETIEDWVKLPPATISAKLYGIKINPDIQISEITKVYAETFLGNGPFDANTIEYDNNIPCVELRKNEKLVYEDLIRNGIFLRVAVDQ